MLTPPADQQELDQQAADWLVAHDRGLNTDETQRFQDWLRRSSAHAEAWQHAKHVWDGYQTLEPNQLEEMRRAALAMRSPWWRKPNGQTAIFLLVVFIAIVAIAWALSRHPAL
jgi:transmembrane sensor